MIEDSTGRSSPRYTAHFTKITLTCVLVHSRGLNELVVKKLGDREKIDLFSGIVSSRKEFGVEEG